MATRLKPVQKLFNLVRWKKAKAAKKANDPGMDDPEKMAGTEISHDPHEHAWIAAQAYYKAEQRGFEPRHELDDWLEAEQECLMNKSNSPPIRSRLKSLA